MKEKTVKYIAWAAAIAWLGVMFFLAAQPGEESSALSGSFSGFIGKIFGIEDAETLNGVVRKLAHFVGFLIEGALARFAVRLTIEAKCATEATILSGAVLCALNELTQLFTPDRGFSLTDMCIDFAGFALGACVVAIIAHAVKSRAYRYL